LLLEKQTFEITPHLMVRGDCLERGNGGKYFAETAPICDSMHEAMNVDAMLQALNQHELKKREEQKRDAADDPVQRWLHIQQTTTWAEANLPPHLWRNRPRTGRNSG
jgi:hypothetical protein